MKVVHELLAHFDAKGALSSRRMLKMLDKGGLATEAPMGGMHGLCDTAGATYYFRVRGQLEGQIWGTDVYTRDSTLGAAAVHAGLLKPEETGILRVTVVPARDSYPGSARNGVTTQDYGPFPHAWVLSRV
jgi:hypothetical protein